MLVSLGKVTPDCAGFPGWVWVCENSVAWIETSRGKGCGSVNDPFSPLAASSLMIFPGLLSAAWLTGSVMRSGHPKREFSFRFAQHEAVCRVCTAGAHVTVAHGEMGR